MGGGRPDSHTNLRPAQGKAMVGPKATRSFHTKVAGISRHQRIAKQCDEGDVLSLEREPDNPADPNAIKVSREDGPQIGYIPAHTARDLAKKMDAGEPVYAVISEITGGTEDKPTTGINLKITIGGAPPTGDGCAAAILGCVIVIALVIILFAAFSC